MGNEGKKVQYTRLYDFLGDEKNKIAETADYIGITETELMAKLKGKSSFSAYEADKICEYMGIKTLALKLYFFYPERPKNGIKCGKGGAAELIKG